MIGRVRREAAEETLLTALEAGVDPGEAWRAYRTEHADILDPYEDAFGATERTPAQLGAAAAGAAGQLRRRAQALALERTLPGLAGIVELECEEDLQAVTFVGWDRAIAWCDDETADPRVYFALERMPQETLRCRVVGAHELAHLAHIRVRPGEWPPWQVVTGIFSEAVAIAAAHALAPELDPFTQVMLQPGARAAYLAARRAVDAELLELLDRIDEQAYRRVLFPPALCQGSVAGVNETGYIVAIALMESWAARGVSLAEAARMTPEQARAELVAILSP